MYLTSPLSTNRLLPLLLILLLLLILFRYKTPYRISHLAFVCSMHAVEKNKTESLYFRLFSAAFALSSCNSLILALSAFNSPRSALA